MKNKIKNFFLKMIFSVLESFMIFTLIYPNFLNKRKLKNVKKLYLTYIVKRIYYSHKTFKQSLNIDQFLNKCMVIKFNQKFQPKSSIDMNIEPLKKAKSVFEKDFSS